MIIKSKIVPIAKSNIDTDQIIPARHLTGISKDGLGQFLFEDLLDNPIDKPEHQGSKIIVTKENFGCGSSREHAVWSILDRGYQAVIAVSFARIFEDNCYNNAVAPVKLSEEEVNEILAELGTDGNFDKEIEIDVVNQKVRYESSVNGTKEIGFELDPLKKEFILHGGFMNFMNKKVPKVQEWAKEHQKI